MADHQLPKSTRGSDLSHEDQKRVLARYVQRYTKEHKPEWANELRDNGEAYPVQFEDDTDWLKHTYFTVRKDGRLDARVNFCHTKPTWPNNPELRNIYVPPNPRSK